MKHSGFVILRPFFYFPHFYSLGTYSKSRSFISFEIVTAWKVSVFGVVLVRIFSYLVWIRANADHNNSGYKHFLLSGPYSSRQMIFPLVFLFTKCMLV